MNDAFEQLLGKLDRLTQARVLEALPRCGQADSRKPKGRQLSAAEHRAAADLSRRAADGHREHLARLDAERERVAGWLAGCERSALEHDDAAASEADK